MLNRVSNEDIGPIYMTAVSSETKAQTYKLGVELGETWLAAVVEHEDGVDHGVESLEK